MNDLLLLKETTIVGQMGHHYSGYVLVISTGHDKIKTNVEKTLSKCKMISYYDVNIVSDEIDNSKVGTKTSIQSR